MIKGKICWIDREEIKKIEPNIDLSKAEAELLYDILEEHMIRQGIMTYDVDEVEFDKEIFVNHYWERRYNCIILRGVKRKDEFILKEAGIQFEYIM